MSMSKKDYELIAKAIKTALENDATEHMEAQKAIRITRKYLIDALQETNDRFNTDRFVAATEPVTL
jgi:hypothetical protein